MKTGNTVNGMLNGLDLHDGIIMEKLVAKIAETLSTLGKRMAP